MKTFCPHTIKRDEVIFDPLNSNDWRQLKVLIKCNYTLLSGDLSQRRNSFSSRAIAQLDSVQSTLIKTDSDFYASELWVCLWIKTLNDGQKTQSHPSADQRAIGTGKNDSKSKQSFIEILRSVKLLKDSLNS